MDKKDKLRDLEASHKLGNKIFDIVKEEGFSAATMFDACLTIVALTTHRAGVSKDTFMGAASEVWDEAAKTGKSFTPEVGHA